MSDTVHQPSSSWSEIKRLVKNVCDLLPPVVCVIAIHHGRVLYICKVMWRILSKFKARDMKQGSFLTLNEI